MKENEQNHKTILHVGKRDVKWYEHVNWYELMMYSYYVYL